MLSLEELRRGRRCVVFALVVDGRADVSDFLNDLPRPQDGVLLSAWTGLGLYERGPQAR